MNDLIKSSASSNLSLLDTSEVGLHVSPSNLEQLIRGVVEDSVKFDDLVEALMPMISGQETLPTETALQLSSALFELEKHALEEDKLYGLVNEHSASALALSEAGQILALNTPASQLFGLTSGDGMRALGIELQAFEEFKLRLIRFNGPTLIKVNRPNTDSVLPLIMSGNYYPRYQAYVLVALQHHWSESVDLALKELFDLSSSERQILSYLAQGMSSEQIAKRRSRSLGTVRQQIKSILQKLGSSSQLEVATFAAAVAAKSSTGHMGDTGLLTRLEQDAPLEIREFRRNLRRISWRRFGDPSGVKVVMLHGPSFGAGEYPVDRNEAMRYGLDIYAIERPGYGRTDPPAKDEDVLECHLQDLLLLIEKAELTEVTLFAHEVGLIPALKLAHQCPDQVKGVLAVSAAPPFLELEQLHMMPDHQAVFIQATRHAPWLMRLMIRLLMIRARQLGPENWTDVIFQGLENEMRVMQKTELKAGVVGTYGFYLNQMGTGFEVDLQMMLKDWGALLNEVQAPITLLHGSENATTPLKYLEIFTQHNSKIHIDILEGEGLTLAVSKADRVYAALADMARISD